MLAHKLEILLQVELQSQADAEELKGMLGLALQLYADHKHHASAPALHLPCQAPFTSMVPDIMRLTHRYSSSSSYRPSLHRSLHHLPPSCVQLFLHAEYDRCIVTDADPTCRWQRHHCKTLRTSCQLCLTYAGLSREHRSINQILPLYGFVTVFRFRGPRG